MYKSCLICHGSLGSNSVLEHGPVGRQFAFDRRTGRLWIVCDRCQAWNLSPEQERWEAVEECERNFDRAVRRYATEHIGLAEIAGGVRLIRIAGPATREFAAWRYSRRWVTRRYRAFVHSAISGLAAGGVFAVGGAVAFSAGAVGLGGYLSLMFLTSIAPSGAQVVTRVPILEDQSQVITRSELRYLRVLRTGHERWALDTQGDTVIEGPALAQALSLLLPILNRWGGSDEHQRHAVRMIDEAGGSEGFMADRHRYNLQTLRSWTRPERLALEMASNEELERRALEGELRLLLAAWREAEELGAIADGLLIPLPVEERFRQLKAQHAGVNVAGEIKQ